MQILNLVTLIIGLSGTGCTTLPPVVSGTRGGVDSQTCAATLPTDADTMIRQRFLLFGDSLTQQSFEEGGWGSKLVSRYQRKADVTLRGYSGYNTR